MEIAANRFAGSGSSVPPSMPAAMPLFLNMETRRRAHGEGEVSNAIVVAGISLPLSGGNGWP